MKIFKILSFIPSTSEVYGMATDEAFAEHTTDFILFLVLFVVTFLIHKPLNVHNSKNRMIVGLHYLLEYAVVIQAFVCVYKLFA